MKPDHGSSSFRAATGGLPAPLAGRVAVAMLLMAYAVAAVVSVRLLAALFAAHSRWPLLLVSGPTPTACATPAAPPKSTPTATATATPTVTPTITPTPLPVHVLGTYPIDGDSDVLEHAPLLIVFDQPMDPDPAGVSLTISPTLPLQISWPQPDRLALAAPPWQPGVTYQVTLHAARSRGGGGLEHPLTLSFSRGGRGAPIPILMYHHVDELAPGAEPLLRELTVSPADLTAHLALFSSLGAQVVPLMRAVDYLARGEPLPARPVVLTFDDGYKSAYEEAFPILRAHGATATFFVSPNNVGESAYMDWGQLKTLVEEGFSLGAHGYRHFRVTHLGPALAELQFGESRRTIEKMTGALVLTFAYPGGAYDQATIAQLQPYGYRAALGVEPLAYQKPSRLFALRRIHVGYGDLAGLRRYLPWKG